MSGVNKGLLAMLAGVGAGAFGRPEEAEAKASPYFAGDLMKALYSLTPRRPRKSPIPPLPPPKTKPEVFAGTLEPFAWEELSKLYPGAANEIYASPHPLVRRMSGKSGWWPFRRTIGKIESLLNDPRTKIVANYSDDKAAAPYALLAETKYGDVYGPLAPRKDGGFYIKSVFIPSQEQKSRALARHGGGNSSSYTDSGRAAEGSQPLPLSDVMPSQSSDIIGGSGPEGNGKQPGIASIPAGALGFGDMTSKGDRRPGNALRQLGLGTRSLMEGAGRALSLGLTDPGRVLADLAGLPSPEPGTPEALASGVVRGGADAMSFMLPGAGMARMAAGPVARGVGQALSASPMAQTAWGSGMGLLDYMLQNAGGKRQN